MQPENPKDDLRQGVPGLSSPFPLQTWAEANTIFSSEGLELHWWSADGVSELALYQQGVKVLPLEEDDDLACITEACEAWVMQTCGSDALTRDYWQEVFASLRAYLALLPP
jgi:hypothetical protein